MIFYHGTSEKAAHKILEEGLQPRRRVKKSNWKHSVQSCPDAVYLTTSYAGYFGWMATDEPFKDRVAVLEIPVKGLLEYFLCPDEDFLAQIFSIESDRWADHAKEVHDKLRGKTMHQKTVYFRNRLRDWHAYWEKSVEYMGTCCLLGPIAPTAISRAVVFDLTKMKIIGTDLLQPSISHWNYAIMGKHYRIATEWLFGKDVTPEEYLDPVPFSLYPEAAKENWRKALNDRSAIKFLKGGPDKQVSSPR